MVTYFPKPLNNQVAAISDSLTRTQEGLGIGASGDTHDAIGSGQFVYVRDHSSLAEGLYKSTAAIAANGALSTSNLTADGSGGLNDLQGQLTTLNSKSITVTNWNCQSNENWSANSWSHIGGGGIPSSAIPSGKTISANLIGIFAVSTESGWTRIVANLRTDAVNDIALSIYSNVAGNTNSIKFKALWL